MEGVLILLIVESFKVLEEFIFSGHFVMVLEVVDNLTEVVRQSIEVDLARDGRPPEVEMRLLRVLHLGPKVGAGLIHDTAN